MKIYIPSPLRSYTGKKSSVSVIGVRTVRAAVDVLEKDSSGIRFRMIDERDRIREYIKIFVNMEQISTLDTSVMETDEIHIIAALSGG